MRNTVFVLMGQTLISSALKLKQYVLQQGMPAANDYLQVLTWKYDGQTAPEAACPSVTVAHCERTQFDKSSFCSDLSQQYQVTTTDEQTLATDHEVKNWWTNLFSHTVTLQHQGDSTSLHICIVVPLWETKSVHEAIRLAQCMNALSYDFVIDVFCIPSTIASLFDNDEASVAANAESRKQESGRMFDRLLDAKKGQRLLHSLVMVEGCNTNGIALDMDYSTWLKILGEYSLLAVENYNILFPINTGVQNDCMTFGLSALEFDRYYFIHYLLRRAYLKIMNREHVDQEKVDINKVAQIAHNQLLKHYHIFRKIYDTEVVQKLRQGQDENSIQADIKEIVERETCQMELDFQSFIDSEELTLPEKQATLAQLLGLNDELFAGNLFERDLLTYEDCVSDVIETFVREDNLLGDKGILTTPKDPLTGLIYSPIKELKQLRKLISESDRFIHEKSDELELWRTQITESVDSDKRLTPEGFVYGDVTYRFMDDQEIKLFEETYVPEDVEAKSVDMRSMFTDIRDQKRLGACTVFAMVSVYEFLLKKLGNTKIDLSEHFVYYNVSVDDDGQVRDRGSSLHDVAESMSNWGVCLEEIWRYTGSLEKPSTEAYVEAKNHKLTQVKNVSIGPDIHSNHHGIVSALANGYPVIISLKLYNSFGKNIKGFIQRPTDEEKQLNKHGNHCMVIVGYSDDERVYIVRNSWGRSFGDNGYCYIPYSYIDDHEYCNQACIITKIAESDSLGGFGKNVIPTVRFSITDANIRYAIASIQIAEEKVRLNALQKQYHAFATDYFKLTSDLENNMIRSAILEGAEKRLDDEILQKEQEKKQFMNIIYPQTLKGVKEGQRSKWFVYWGIWAAWLLVLTLTLSIDSLRNWVNQDYWTIMAIIAVILSIFGIAYKFYCKSVYNNIERELDNRRDQIAKAVQALKLERENKHLKLYIAGLFIQSFNKVYHLLDHRYKLLRSYVGNLCQWMGDETDAVKKMQVVEKTPFIPILKNSVLDCFFETKQDEITAPIRLYRFLDEAGLSDDDIIGYKTKVRDEVASLLESQFADFSIADYVMAVKNYPYLSDQETDIAALLNKLNRQSDCFLQVRQDGTINMDLVSRYVLLHIDDTRMRLQWTSLYPRHFEQMPSDVPSFTSPFKLIELQVRYLGRNQIEALHIHDKAET